MWLPIILIVFGALMVLFSFQSLIWILGIILFVIGIYLANEVKKSEVTQPNSTKNTNSNREKYMRVDKIEPPAKTQKSFKTQYSQYDNHCWNCGTPVSSERNIKCPNCGWYICSKCGACGCEYHK